MKNNKGRFWFIWTLLALALITVQCILPGEKSDAESRAVLEFLWKYFPKLTHDLLRQIAHFGEFFLLGMGMQGTLFYGKKYNLSKPTLFCAFVALADETAQLKIAERSSEILDVWTDLAGAIVGILFLWCIFKLQKK